MLARDAVLGEDRVHTVLERRAHRGQGDPMAQQLPEVAQLPGSDVGLGEQIGAQQVRQGLGIDRVGLHPRRGDRPRAQRMGKMDVIA